MTIQIDALPSQVNFGALVRGLTSADIEDPAVVERLRALWIDHGVVLFRGGECNEEFHVRLSKVFGEPTVHPLLKTLPDVHPNLVDIRYDRTSGWLYEIDGRTRGAWLPWHSDLVYVDRINRGGILRAICVPRSDGETGFIDQISAYATLPERSKKRIEGLNVLYKFDIDASHQKFARNPRLRTISLGKGNVDTMARNAHLPRSIHPLVYTQQETGRKVLHLSPWFALGIEGMENPEGDAVLEELAQHITRADGAYYHRWQAGDMVLWDNWRMLHCGAGVNVDDERFLQRTTLLGDYGLGRFAEPTDIPEGVLVDV